MAPVEVTSRASRSGNKFRAEEIMNTESGEIEEEMVTENVEDGRNNNTIEDQIMVT